MDASFVPNILLPNRREVRGPKLEGLPRYVQWVSSQKDERNVFAADQRKPALEKNYFSARPCSSLPGLNLTAFPGGMFTS